MGPVHLGGLARQAALPPDLQLPGELCLPTAVWLQTLPEASCLCPLLLCQYYLMNQVLQHLGLTSSFCKVCCMLLNVWLHPFIAIFLQDTLGPGDLSSRWSAWGLGSPSLASGCTSGALLAI